MVMEPRPYCDLNDWNRMMALLAEGWQADNGNVYPHLGDVNWWLYYHCQGKDWATFVYVWEDGDRLLAWAMLWPDEDYYDLFAVPELHGTAQAEAMIAWCEQAQAERVRAAGGKAIRVMWIDKDDR